MNAPVKLIVKSNTSTVRLALATLMNKLPVHIDVEREALVRELRYDGPTANYAIGIYPEGLTFAINTLGQGVGPRFKEITATKLLQIARGINKHE